MKRTLVIYWVSTGLLALMMAFSAYAYLTKDSMHQAFVHLGLPDWFRVELAIAKLLGAVALVAPLPPRLKEWTYAGFSLSFISGFIAHVVVGDAIGGLMPPLVALVVLVVSYVTYHRRLSTANT